MLTSFPPRGRFSFGQHTATAGTAIALLIPPRDMRSFIHVTSIHLTTNTTTAHSIYLCRPKNWTTLSANAATGQLTMSLTADPGKYSTNYQNSRQSAIFGSSLTGVAAGLVPLTSSVADDLIGSASSPYVAYQSSDGVWQFSTVTTVATLVISLAANVPGLGGNVGALSGTRLYYFGAPGDTDPSTGLADELFSTLNTKGSANLALENTSGDAIFSTLHPGDPLLIYSANATNRTGSSV